MGLDTTHDAWHGSYSSFNAFRLAIADRLGWPHTTKPWGGETYMVPYEKHEANGEVVRHMVEGRWKNPPADIIEALLLHSDCDGWLEVDMLEPLAERLEGLADEGGWENWIEDSLRQFAVGCRTAALKGEPMEFQ